MLRLILSALGLVVIFFVGVFAYSGGFYTVTVTEGHIGPFALAYQSNVGDYKQTGATVDRLIEVSQKLSVTPTAAFGQYYDDPNLVPSEKLRSDAGIIIDYRDMGKFHNYVFNKKSEPKILLREYPKTRAVIADFPLRGILSAFIGIMKTYPALMEYMKSKGYPMTYSFEIYPMNEKKVQYAFPLKELVTIE